MALGIACGGDDDDGDSKAATSAAQGMNGVVKGSGPDTNVAGPVSRYAILVQDVGIDLFLTDTINTYDISIGQYALTQAFDTQHEGRQYLKDWGYAAGFETALLPEGRTDAILNGSYIIYVETHVFLDTAGAHTAFEYFVNRIANNGVSKVLPSDPVGNESFLSTALDGTVGGTSVALAKHQVIFRRGNLIAIVQTAGSDGLMKPGTVQGLARLMDAKALGNVAAPTPTPIPRRSGQFENTPQGGTRQTTTPVRTPTPAGTPR